MTFSTTRREASDYVKNNNYDKAKQHFDDAKRALEGFQSSGTDGLKAEAAQWAHLAEGPLAQFLGQMRKIHAEFVDKFQGDLGRVDLHGDDQRAQ